MAQTRTKRLNLLFNNVLEGKRTAASNNPKLFLEAICAQTSAVISIPRLVASPQGLEFLLLAFSSDTSLPFLNGQLTLFLEYVQVPELQAICDGSVLRRVLSKLMEAPLTWKSLVKAAQDQDLEQDALSAFAWLLIQLLSLPVEEARSYLTEAQDPDICRALTSSSDEVKARGQRIAQIANRLLGNSTYEQRKDTQRGPGGRHDNDYVDFHEIAIYPTRDELKLKTSDVYLPRASDVTEPDQDADGLAKHIESQFRLLRENMLCDLRDELAASKQPKHRKPLEIRNLALNGVHCDKRFFWSLKLMCKDGLPQFRKRSAGERKKFLLDHPKFLKHSMPLCLFVNDRFVTLGTLFREDDLLVRSPSILCVQIPPADAKKVLMELKGAGSNIRLLHIDTAMFTYEPVLKQLRRMQKLSLAPEIVGWEAGTSVPPPDYYVSSTLKWLLEDLCRDYSMDLKAELQLEQSTKLDRAQAQCFQAALQQRVVLIQGPPGTGKSFIGSLVAKAIHQSTRQKILVVCYTHHALDDFVEHLLDLGIPGHDIVRLGSTHKATPRTKALGLNEYKQSIKFTRDQWSACDLRKRQVIGVAEDLNDAFHQFVKFNPRTQNQRDLLEFLESHDDDLPFHSVFKLPVDKDGMRWVGKGGKELDEYYLLERWLRGQDAGIFKSWIPYNYRAVWQLTYQKRNQMYQRWYHEMTEKLLTKACEAGLSYNCSIEAVDAVFLEKDLAVMRSKRIIACTTTAAAKYSDIIQQVSPGIVLVEEAGEILESHVLTALGPKTKHLILIGDHKQLRPKANYELSVEKGNGYDLNRSLFERLILKGFPYQTLFTQHRMRVEISALIREMTYPELKDASETFRRPNLRGFTDSIIFVNHKEPETEISDTNELGDSKQNKTKQNQFEAKMTLKCVRYLGQQGYRTDDIVVLTPYLGQLRLLHDELKIDSDLVLNDLDAHDLVRAGLMPEVSAQENKPRLRISTVDNFQGEEANIVIASLCRSNIDRDIGFMSAPERLNVLISRARDAIILIGNADHFMGSRKGGDLWKRFIGLLKAGMHVYNGVPVSCQGHPHSKAILRKPADFDSECPDGGCKAPCNKTLNCGIHKCPDRCHLLYDHSNIKCNGVISASCVKGHVNSRICHVKDPLVCVVCPVEAKKARETAKQMMEAREAERLHVSKIAELDRKIEAIKAEAAPKRRCLLSRFIVLLTAGVRVSDGLPVTAAAAAGEQESDLWATLQKSADSTGKSSDGKRCGKVLNCGIHKCCDRSRGPHDHAEIKCYIVVSSWCEKGHVYNCECHAKDVCTVCKIEAEKAQEEAEWKVKVLQKKKQDLLRLAELDEEIKASKAKAILKPFTGNAPIKTSIQDAQPARSVNTLNLSATPSVVQKGYPPVIERQQSPSSQQKLSNAGGIKTSIQGAQPARSVNMLNLSATPSVVQKAYPPVIERQQLPSSQQKLSNAGGIKTSIQGAQPARSVNTLNLSVTSSVVQKAYPPVIERQQLPSSQRKLSNAGGSSQAKAEQARIHDMKLKRAQDAEEHRLNALREEQLRERKREQKAQKKLRDLGISAAQFPRTNQSGSFRLPEKVTLSHSGAHPPLRSARVPPLNQGCFPPAWGLRSIPYPPAERGVGGSSPGKF